MLLRNGKGLEKQHLRGPLLGMGRRLLLTLMEQTETNQHCGTFFSTSEPVVALVITRICNCLLRPHMLIVGNLLSQDLVPGTAVLLMLTTESVRHKPRVALVDTVRVIFLTDGRRD